MNNTGFVEGWGLYCENFSDLHTDKEMIVNIRRNYSERFGWLWIPESMHSNGPIKSFDYMHKHLDYTDEVIRSKLYNHICTLRQALSYKVGELTFYFTRSLFEKVSRRYPRVS